MEEILKKKEKKERKKEKINSNKSNEKKNEERGKKNRVKEDVVESRGETWVKKREHANGADKEGSAQERQARGSSVSWFPWNWTELNGTPHTSKRHQTTGTEVSRGGSSRFFVFSSCAAFGPCVVPSFVHAILLSARYTRWESRIFLSLDLHGSSLLIIRDENWRRYCWYTRDQVSSMNWMRNWIELNFRENARISNSSSFFLIL